MGLLDKAKAAASELAAKADSAMSSMSTTATGAPRPADIDKYFRDLGVLTFQEASGRGADDAERERVLGVLRDFDAQGAIRSLALVTTPPPAPGMAGTPGAVPPPPGMAGATPPPPAPGMAEAAVPPPPPGMAGATPSPAPPAPAEVTPPPAPAAPTAPPPPPSWMSGDSDTTA